MTWTGYNEAMPLIFLNKRSMRQCRLELSYEMPEAIELLLPDEEISLELMLIILIQNKHIEEAVQILCYGLTPREAMWWAICCYRLIKAKQAADFSKDGLSPSERRKKSIKDIVAKLSDTSDIEAVVAANLAAQQKIADDCLKTLEGVPSEKPADRMDALIGGISGFMDGLIASLPPEEQASWSAPSAETEEFLKKEIDRIYQEQLAEFAPTQATIPPELEPIGGAAIAKMIREKTGAIKPAIDGEMAKYFPLKIRGLPQEPSEKKLSAAFEAAITWLLDPTDENGYLACQAAIAAKSGPECILAYCAFWSSSLMVSDTGRAPGNPALPPRGYISLITQLILIEIDDFDYDARYAEFLRIGIACAQGISTWDDEGNEVLRKSNSNGADDNVLNARFGFGRQ